jgi:hypothetical protein
MRSPSLSSEHTQNPRSTPNIEHRLAFEEMRVIDDRSSVRSSSDGILQHLFVNAYSNRKTSDQTRQSNLNASALQWHNAQAAKRDNQGG